MTLIYKTLAGSRLYGTYHSTSDYDFRGVILEPVESLIGLSKPFEQIEPPAKLHDEVYWGLRKFIKLVLQNNPNIMDVLFAPPSARYICDERMQWLLDHRTQFLSQRIRATFVGYAMSQMKLIDRKQVKEHEPYNTKHAAHLLRLLFQAKTILAEGDFNPVLSGNERTEVLAALHGKTPLESIMSRANELWHEVDAMPSSLPLEPNTDGLEAYMMNVYKEHINKSVK